jgi:parallel beta-helix repeat protein
VRPTATKKSTSIVLILISLMALGTICIKPIKGQTQSFFTINSDGTVSPQTNLIKQTDNVYVLTSDMDTSVLTLQKSNLVLDGNGHILTNGQISILSVRNVTVQNFSITNTGSIVIFLDNTTDITIRNTTITSAVTPFGMIGGILVENSNSTTISENTIKSGMFGILLSGSQHSLIIQNYIRDNSNGWGYHSAGIIFEASSNNTVYYNNFVNNDHGAAADSNSINTWDNGKVGNYWSDYQSKYPNATEIGNSGIGNTQYFINASNTDNYPLIYPVNISATAPIPTPTKSSPTIILWNQPEVMTIVVIISIIAILIVSLLLYRRHRKSTNLNK